MNPRSRLLTTLRGGEPDRVPLILHGFHYESVDDVEESCKREIVERIIEETHFTAGFPSFVNRYLVTPPQRIREVSREEHDGTVILKSEIDTPRGTLTAAVGQNPVTRTTWTIKYPVESLEDVERISSVPWELPPDLATPDPSRLRASFDKRGICQTGVSSPFVCVAGMMPYQYFLELCGTELDLLKELTAQCFERILTVLDVLLANRTVDLVWMGGCEWLTPPMGSAKQYEELVQQFERPIIDRIHAGGALSHVHCHGNVRSTLEMVIERGADYFEPVEPPPDGDITFDAAKSIVAGRMVLGGNIEARVLEREDEASVREAVVRAFEGGKRHMILQDSASPISAMTPDMIRNYHTLIDVWEELGAL